MANVLWRCLCATDEPSGRSAFRSRLIQIGLRTAWAWIVALGFGPVADAQSAATENPSPGPRIEQLIDQGILDEASAALDQRVASEGETARNLLFRGLIAYRRQAYQVALEDLKRSFALDETDPSTSKALGLCLVKLGREDLAETFFEIAASLVPEDFTAHYYLGLNAYTTRRFDRATASFRKAVELRPNSVEGNSFLGRSYEALGKPNQARRHYLRASELNRGLAAPSANPPLLLGSMLYRESRLDRAEHLLREALRYDGDAALAHYWLGLVLERRSDLGPAIGALRRAAALAPHDHRPHYALARIYQRTGDAARAEESVRKFRELRIPSESETY